MEVSRIRALRGPNLWTRHTAVEALVRCEGDELDLELEATQALFDSVDDFPGHE